MRESEVVESEQVEQGCVEVVDVDGIARDVPSDLIRFTVGESAFESAARHEDGESEGVVISAGDIFAAAAVFAEWGASELACDNDECFVEETALFQIFDERSDGLVGHPSIECEFVIEVGVMVP